MDIIDSRSAILIEQMRVEKENIAAQKIVDTASHGGAAENFSLATDEHGLDVSQGSWLGIDTKPFKLLSSDEMNGGISAQQG